MQPQAEVTFGWDIYLLAGVGSSRTIFTECMKDLQRRYAESGMSSRIRVLYPYGDHTQNLYYQLLKVRKDLYRLRKAVQSGAKAASEHIRQLSAGRPVLFIGHSGGGVAAYQAAVMLGQEGVIPDWRVVQIGSPRLPIHEAYADKVHCIVAVDEKGYCADYITRLGSWGGISRNRFGIPFWDRDKYAPKHIIPIRTIGGHQHYFRIEAPFVHPERGTNLGLVTDTIWEQVASNLGRTISGML
ncbi:hypothetical protein GZH47_30175 [Paenibacillus rhizovicinus]|uniref:Fungal lipase-like domain-containing protein n=1 Tax=Paenibacillus rhizovicinus TaxID=2704463 RepID=A0A6C0P7N3_9BACL|nr:hypothetical protein [Paenibacillus rhizovicinus]QHW34640.1 hypothetical protein GZH47_30175 [Paenibacillus rhizovicinus]